MKARRLPHRWALWVFAAALLLKAAVPWLASAAAEAQGKTLVEVCTVYGVSLVPLDGSGPTHDPAPDAGLSHAGDHCALGALASFTPPAPQGFDPPPAEPRGREPVLAHPSAQAPDACATWVARLKHGPPIPS